MTAARRLLSRAKPEDAAALLELRQRVDARQDEIRGLEPRPPRATLRGVLANMREGSVWVVRRRGRILGALTLGTRKPWAIDVAHFTPVRRPLYLTGMMIDPERQRQGIGRRCMDEVIAIAAEWPAEAIRLDAFDRPDGAGGFYDQCGFREVGRVRYRGTPLIYFERVLEG